MQVTRGMRRQSMKLARHRAILPVDALIAGVDLAKKESVVIFTRAADRGRLAKLTIPTDRTGVERLVARAAMGAATTPPISNPTTICQLVSPMVSRNVTDSAKVTKNSAKLTEPMV